MSKNVPIKSQKPQLCYCPDGLLIKLRDFQAEGLGSNPACLTLFFSYTLPIQIDAKKSLTTYNAITTLLTKNLDQSVLKQGITV